MFGGSDDIGDPKVTEGMASRRSGASPRPAAAAEPERAASLRRYARARHRRTDFDLPDQDGNDVKLSDLKGQTVVLYFYPQGRHPWLHDAGVRDRDHPPDVDGRRRARAGVSPDPVKAAQTFDDKQALNFTLLADEDHAICDAYGVWGEKQMYGKTYMGAQRATFIIDGSGTIAARDPEGLAEDARRRGAQGARRARCRLSS